MQQQKILLVESDREFGNVLRSFLEKNEFKVTLSVDGGASFKGSKDDNYNLCILDVTQPKINGITHGVEIKENNPDVPVIFITSKSSKGDVIDGFKIGMDDYISKPFYSEDLLYKVVDILKKANGLLDSNAHNKEFIIGNYHFNYPLRVLTFETEGIRERKKLSPKEAHLLRLLCLHKNKILSRSHALMEIWKEDNYFVGRSMDVFVTRLRKLLKKDNRLEIANVHGNGFILNDDRKGIEYY